MGNAAWELTLLEHGLTADGHVNPDIATDTHRNDSYETIFTELGNGKFVPRSIFVDLDPSPIDEIRTGTYRNLFHPEQLISGRRMPPTTPSQCVLDARGHYTIGKMLVEGVVDRICHNCSSLQDFIIFHSFGGGTGSGFGALLLEHLSSEYGKMSRLEFAVYPSPRTSTAVVEPYNAILSTHSTIENSDCAFLMDNEAVYDICKRKLDIPRPGYNNLNRLNARVVSSLTTSLRFNDDLKIDLNEFQTNLILFPLAPLYQGDMMPHECAWAVINIKANTSFNLKSIFVLDSELASVDCLVTMLFNLTAITEAWIRLGYKFDLIY
ncbi:Tubulin/FtsZ, GTPase domain-containing protein [Aspergillus californicus]